MEEAKLRLDGAVVYWHLSKYTDRPCLNRNLTTLGLPEVEQRTASSVLQDAIEDVHAIGDKFLVRPLNRGKKKGYCVVREDRGDTTNQYDIVCSYTIDDKEKIEAYAGSSSDQLEQVSHRFQVLRETLKNQQVSAMLLVQLRKMDGIRLNPNGFAYWIPETSRQAWMGLGAAVKAASLGTTEFYSLTHKFDADGLVAVKDALIRDVTTEIKEINEDVESGKLRVRALEARTEQAQALRAKVERYEALLGETLVEIKDQVEEAQFASAQASLMQAVAREESRIAKVNAQLVNLGVEIGSEGEG